MPKRFGIIKLEAGYLPPNFWNSYFSEEFQIDFTFNRPNPGQQGYILGATFQLHFGGTCKCRMHVRQGTCNCHGKCRTCPQIFEIAISRLNFIFSSHLTHFNTFLLNITITYYFYYLLFIRRPWASKPGETGSPSDEDRMTMLSTGLHHHKTFMSYAYMSYFFTFAMQDYIYVAGLCLQFILLLRYFFYFVCNKTAEYYTG